MLPPAIRKPLVAIVASILWVWKEARKHADLVFVISTVAFLYSAQQQGFLAFSSTPPILAQIYIATIAAVSGVFTLSGINEKMREEIDHPNKEKHLKRMFLWPFIAAALGLLLYYSGEFVTLKADIIPGRIMLYTHFAIGAYSVVSLAGLVEMLARKKLQGLVEQ